MQSTLEYSDGLFKDQQKSQKRISEVPVNKWSCPGFIIGFMYVCVDSFGYLIFSNIPTYPSLEKEAWLLNILKEQMGIYCKIAIG